MQAILSAFFLQGGVAWMASPPQVKPPSTYWAYDVNDVSNPYGVIALGFDHDWGAWNVSLSARHMSSVPASDHGSNTLEVNVRVHPWR